MRPKLSVMALVSGLMLVGGCDKHARMTTAPEPTPDVRAATEAERAVEARTAQVMATKPEVSVIAAAAIVFDVPPEVFGTAIDNRLFYVASKKTNGVVSGVFSYTQSSDGSTSRFAGRITCMNVYDFDGGTSNRAKLGGPIDFSDDPTIPVGTYIWWQQIDNARSPGRPPDKSTLSGFGDAAANKAFCESPNPPRFGPFDVDLGNILVVAPDGSNVVSGVGSGGRSLASTR